MIVRPKENFTLLGYGAPAPRLDKNRNYTAIPAINQPDWLEKGKVFVSFHDDGEEPSILLDHFDYDLIKP